MEFLVRLRTAITRVYIPQVALDIGEYLGLERVLLLLAGGEHLLLGFDGRTWDRGLETVDDHCVDLLGFPRGFLLSPAFFCLPSVGGTDLLEVTVQGCCSKLQKLPADLILQEWSIQPQDVFEQKFRQV